MDTKQSKPRARETQPRRSTRTPAPGIAASEATIARPDEAAALRAECESLRLAVALGTEQYAALRSERDAMARELATLRRVVGVAEGIRSWAIATARDVDGLVSDPQYQPSEPWEARRDALRRLARE